MDERKLNQLFNTAVPDTPPPTFDVHDIAAESGRQTLRKRNALLGGSVLGLVVLTGATLVGLALWKSADSQGTSAAAGAPMVADSTGNREAVPSEVPNGVPKPQTGAGDESFSAESRKQGRTSAGNAGPPGPGSTLNGCGQADRELAAALAGELPAAAGLEPLVATAFCPPGARAATVPLSENGKSGFVTVVVTRPGTRVDYPVNGSPEGTVVGTAAAKDGRAVYVISEPTNGSTGAPFGDQVQRAAEGLAGKL